MQPDRLNTLLLNLNAFSQTGGIEKVSRVLTKACYEIAEKERTSFCNFSLYDSQSDSRYCPESNYKAFGGNKINFVSAALKAGRKADKLVLTHINLALVALLIKLVNPRIKIFLFAHGIEIWRSLSAWKRYLLFKAHKILAVSGYTQKRISAKFPRLAERIQILNNCLDPLFEVPNNFEKPENLVRRYGIPPGEKVILTLCRLSSSEKYKGYDQVIKALSGIKNREWKYLLMGKYDEGEKERVEHLLRAYGLEDKVTLTGFIPDEEITAHFLLGDLFIMPSTDEGFGIVFIEAAACGLPLIAGNKDGSSDALLNGKLGSLIDPDNIEEIRTAIQESLSQPGSPEKAKEISKKCAAEFGYSRYVEKLTAFLSC